MKKIFPLHVPGMEDMRVAEAIKLTVTKYVKRERRKKLPEGVDFWDFNCKVGPGIGTASATHLAAVPKAVDAMALGGGVEVYVEVVSCPGLRAKNAPCQREEA